MPQRYVIETPRLTLREMSEADIDFVSAMLADPEVMRYYPAPLSRTEAEGWLERQQHRYRQDGHGLWLVEFRATSEPVVQDHDEGTGMEEGRC